MSEPIERIDPVTGYKACALAGLGSVECRVQKRKEEKLAIILFNFLNVLTLTFFIFLQ